MMTSTCLQEEAKLILTYSHKAQLNQISYLAIVATFLWKSSQANKET